MKSLAEMPAFMTPADLVELGLFKDTQAAYYARIRGYAPEFVRIGRKIRYSKEAIKRWANIHEEIVPANECKCEGVTPCLVLRAIKGQ